MPQHHRLLFLYMVPETGHQKAAEAIIEAARHLDPSSDCVGIDAGNQTYPFLGSMINRMYLRMLKSAPFIWEYLYDNPDVEAMTREARGLLTFISSFRMKKILKKYHPTCVICTQAAPAVALAAEKKRGNLPIPLICVVTDFGVHTYWRHQEVDLYLVGHEEIRQELIKKGIHPNKIRVTGIPIHPKFGETVNQQEARQRLRLHPNKQTLLLMGGSQGFGSLDQVVESLLTLPTPVQTLVVCGRNRRLQKKISDLTRHRSDFHVYGYLKDTSQVMSAADILITKPGGLTCSEALAKQLPMILTNPIPGQEEKNVRFLTRHQIARVVRSSEELTDAVYDLIRRPKQIQSMRQRAKIISRPLSSWEAARLIFDLINRRGSFARPFMPYDIT